MPLRIIAEVDRPALYQKVDNALTFFLDQQKIDIDVQYLLFANGTTSMRRLANLEDDKAKVREVIKKEYGLDGNENMAIRGHVSDLMDAWEEARDVLARERDARAEHKAAATGIPLPTDNHEHTGMRKAFEKVHGKIADRHDPGRYLLGSKLEQVQNNDPQLEELDSVSHRMPGEDEGFSCEVERDGRFKVRKGVKKVGEHPRTTEDLRDKYHLLSNVWLYAKLRHPGRDWLKDLTPKTYQTMVDHLLGPKVAWLEIETSFGPKMYPSRKSVCHYERAIRRLAYEFVRDGDDQGNNYTLAEALKKACADPECRQLNFVTRLDNLVAVPFTDNERGGGGRGRGSNGSEDNGGRNRGAGNNGNRQSTEKGKAICHFYNSEKGCHREDCGFSHCCKICLAGQSDSRKAHPQHECPQKKSKGKKGGGRGNGRKQVKKG